LFLMMVVIGIVGLVMMAVPALGGHRPLGPMHGHGLGLGHHGAHAPGHIAGAGHAPGHIAGAGHAPGHIAGAGHGAAGHVHPTEIPASGKLVVATTARGGHRFIPSPRAVFSLLALYGAFGNALVQAVHLPLGQAALIAIGPALLVERLLIRPVWNLLFRFQAGASSPLEELILTEAHAVVPFRNGRGLVTTIRDGRRVQLNARLSDQDAAAPVNVGQRLRIEDVDARRERVTVSLLANDKATNNPTQEP
jgi:hypothetical protein